MTRFLNTFLTESLGIAILEAAWRGRRVGVSQALPPDMISRVLAEEDGKIRRLLSLCRTQITETHSDIICAMCKIILRFSVRNHGPWHAHKRVRELYSW